MRRRVFLVSIKDINDNGETTELVTREYQAPPLGTQFELSQRAIMESLDNLIINDGWMR